MKKKLKRGYPQVNASLDKKTYDDLLLIAEEQKMRISALAKIMIKYCIECYNEEIDKEDGGKDVSSNKE